MRLINITTEDQVNKLFLWFNDPNHTTYFNSKKKSKEQIKKMLEIPNNYNWIIVENDQEVGWVSLCKSDKSGVISILVSKKFQGKGLGLKAMKCMEKKAKGMDISKLVLNVFEENVKAISLYKKLGYKELSKQIRMEKKI